ncbi:hypothetical protein YB2330_001739 [Saitoella coloradoensis]
MASSSSVHTTIAHYEEEISRILRVATVTAPAWMTAGLVSLMYTIIRHVTTIIASFILYNFLRRGVTQLRESTLGERIGVHELHSRVSTGSSVTLLYELSMNKRMKVVLTRTLAVITFGILHMVGVELASTLTDSYLELSTNVTRINVTGQSLLFNGYNVTNGAYILTPSNNGSCDYQMFRLATVDETIPQSHGIALPAATCWAPVSPQTVVARGICEGVTFSCSPYEGPICVSSDDVVIGVGWCNRSFVTEPYRYRSLDVTPTASSSAFSNYDLAQQEFNSSSLLFAALTGLKLDELSTFGNNATGLIMSHLTTAWLSSWLLDANNDLWNWDDDNLTAGALLPVQVYDDTSETRQRLTLWPLALLGWMIPIALWELYSRKRRTTFERAIMDDSTTLPGFTRALRPLLGVSSRVSTNEALKRFDDVKTHFQVSGEKLEWNIESAESDRQGLLNPITKTGRLVAEDEFGIPMYPGVELRTYSSSLFSPLPYRYRSDEGAM